MFSYVETPGIDPVHYAWYGRVTVALRLYQSQMNPCVRPCKYIKVL